MAANKKKMKMKKMKKLRKEKLPPKPQESALRKGLSNQPFIHSGLFITYMLFKRPYLHDCITKTPAPCRAFWEHKCQSQRASKCLLEKL